jgi:hypothetical protein
MGTGSNGVQIIPPHDSGIANAIDTHLEVANELWDPESIIASSDLCIDQTEKLKEAYIETLATIPVARYVPMSFIRLQALSSELTFDSAQYEKESFTIHLYTNARCRSSFRPVSPVSLQFSC